MTIVNGGVLPNIHSVLLPKKVVKGKGEIKEGCERVGEERVNEGGSGELLGVGEEWNWGGGVS